MLVRPVEFLMATNENIKQLLWRMIVTSFELKVLLKQEMCGAVLVGKIAESTHMVNSHKLCCKGLEGGDIGMFSISRLCVSSFMLSLSIYSVSISILSYH